MAPQRPSPSSSAARPKSILKKSSEPRNAETDSLFPTNKKDKRRIKHAHLISKVEKSAKTKARKRRPNKKLVANLDSLADALPDDDDAHSTSIQGAGARPEDQVNIIKRKSIKSRPGAMKRREKLDLGERDRFAKNLAQLAGANLTEAHDHNKQKSQAAKPEDRFKALRGFIAQTMEKKPEVSISRG